MSEQGKTPEGYVVIIGGQLQNKGAQAMSFISVAEVKRRFPQLEPVLISTGDAVPLPTMRLKGRKSRPDSKNLNFKVAHRLDRYWCGRRTSVLEKPSFDLKMEVKSVLNAKDYRKTVDVYRNAAFCLDISGFGLGDKWGFEQCLSYLDNLKLCNDFGIPTYLMPQSFGPFDRFDAEQMATLKGRAAEVLPQARMIFAREADGFDALSELCPAGRYRRSADLVLQSGELDLGAVFKEAPTACPHLPSKDAKNVGIVPNMRNYDHGDAGRIDALYRAIIGELLGMGYEVCLVRHAAEDIEACERLKAMFADDSRVEVYGEDRYCYEYGELFSRCEFLVASRFHSIVHAYKEGVPCVATGWAVKYQELLASAGQEDLAFDMTADDLDEDAVLAAVHRVAEERDALSAQIAAMVSRTQQENVFDAVEADFRELRGW